MTEKRPLAWFFSILGTLFQLAVIVETVPDFPGPFCFHCVHPGEPPYVIDDWTPFIENLGTGEWVAEPARCPGPQAAGTTFRLDHAPLPAAFRPFDYKDVLLACVRVDSAGLVRSVRLVAGTGKAGLDRQLLRTISRQWRFAPRGGVDVRPGWQRIRLSRRAPEAAVALESPPPFTL